MKRRTAGQTKALRVRRNKLREIAPEIDEIKIGQLANEANPVVRLGLLLELLDDAGASTDAAEQTRVVTCRGAPNEVEAALDLMTNAETRRGRAAAIGLLGLERGREMCRQQIENGYTSPDDRGYRPTQQDSVLHGPARATGAAARAVRRGTTYAKWQIRD